MKFIILILCLVSGSLAAKPRDTVYIYNDKGVSAESLAHTLYTMHAMLDNKYNIKTLNADAVIGGKWRDNAALFIMPGGADVPYDKALRGKGNQQIKAFVQTGGAYLGICAGGYYGSQKVEFAHGTPLEITGSRELAFFQGTASGPALAPYTHNSNKGARAARLALPNGDVQHAIFYYGGSLFKANPLPSNTSVLARYQDLPNQPAAIVKAKVGAGTAVLSGVHFEYDPALMNRADTYLPPIITALEQHQHEREQLLNLIFKELKI